MQSVKLHSENIHIYRGIVGPRHLWAGQIEGLEILLKVNNWCNISKNYIGNVCHILSKNCWAIINMQSKGNKSELSNANETPFMHLNIQTRHTITHTSTPSTPFHNIYILCRMYRKIPHRQDYAYCCASAAFNRLVNSRCKFLCTLIHIFHLRNYEIRRAKCAQAHTHTLMFAN